MSAPRRALALLLSVVTVIALPALTSDAVSSPRAAASSGTLGYIESGDALSALRRNLPHLTSVGVDGVNISASGAAVSHPDADAHAMLVATHRAGRTAELLVGNFSAALGDFDPDAAHRLFDSARRRRAVITSLVADVRGGWDGIHLDLESLRGADRAGLTRFTAQLRAALPHHATLSMAVMASTTTQGYRDLGYDLPALSRSLTRVVVMAYDQHGPTWTAAGPIGGLPWAERAVRVVLRYVPRQKVVLGVAGYGYTWPDRGTGTQLGDAAARRAAIAPVWDAAQGEWHGRLRGGGIVWWSDARSLQVRRALAARLGLRGVAVWSLGLCDPIG